MKVAIILILAALAVADDVPHYGYAPPAAPSYIPPAPAYAPAAPAYAPSAPDYALAASAYTHKELAYDEPAAYAYNYGVDDYKGVKINAGEQRDGDATSGFYSVALPDGRLQTVNYKVADAYSGYVADVVYTGEATYPAHTKPDYVSAPATYVSAPTPNVPAPATFIPVPASAPYVPASAPYVPAQDSYVPAQSSYIPAPASYAPAAVPYVPAPAPYVPDLAPYVPALTPYASAPAYRKDSAYDS
jgi:hypothetical protein